jgi:hypothetical protein
LQRPGETRAGGRWTATVGPERPPQSKSLHCCGAHATSELGQKRLTCSTAVCLLSPGADMVSCSFFLPSPRIFGSANEPKRDLLSLERRHSITIDQRDLSAGMVVHPVDATRGDEVARLNDKVLHANSIREKSAALNAKSPDGVVSRLQQERNRARPPQHAELDTPLHAVCSTDM